MQPLGNSHKSDRGFVLGLGSVQGNDGLNRCCEILEIERYTRGSDCDASAVLAKSRF